MDALAPCARWSILVVYAFATFHKLNDDFFNPASSCASVFYTDIRSVIPSLPGDLFILRLLPWATIGLEGGIPLLLLSRRTRGVGLLLAFAFHSFLALDLRKHFFDFTSTMFALLFFFLPDERSRGTDSNTSVSRRRLLRFFSAVYAASIAAALLQPRPGAVLMFFVGRQLLWLGVNIFLGYRLVCALRDRWASTTLVAPWSFPRPLLWVPVVLLLLNGLGPYVGYRTRGALDMYSNLRMEGGKPNHWLVPQTLDALGHMNDLVHIVATNDTRLREDYIDANLLITYFELRRVASQRSDMSITYDRAGQRYHFAPARDNPDFESPPPLWIRQLVWYRPVDPDPVARCQW